MDRRFFLAAGAAGAFAPAFAFAAEREPLPKQLLWPNGPPGAPKIAVKERVERRTPGGDSLDLAFYNIAAPMLLTRRPASPNGASILICPGGGFARIALNIAGSAMDVWFAELGYTVHYMTYRLPADGWAAGPLTPAQDVQRAVRVVRADAKAKGLDENRIAVMGFSAGGHVAGQAATRFAQRTYEPVDAADTLSARPDAAALFFPVITMDSKLGHGGSVKNLIGAEPSADMREAFSVEKHVPADAPPAFFAAPVDDPVVPYQNARLAFEAWRAQKIATELHIFESGGHGLPFRMSGEETDPRARLVTAFLKRRGI
jgi:acetyl esterase/lipase